MKTRTNERTKNLNVRKLRNRRTIRNSQFEIRNNRRRRVDTRNDVSFISMNANIERLS